MWCVWRERNAQSFRGCWNCSWTLKLLLLKTLYDLMAARTYFSFSNLFGVSLLIKKKKKFIWCIFCLLPMYIAHWLCLFSAYIHRTTARVYERLYFNYFKWNSRMHEGLFDLWWPNWNIYCYWVLTFDITCSID